MARIDYLLKKYKWLKVALFFIPIIYGAIVWFITKTSKRVKLAILIVTLIFGLIYSAVVFDFFKTKKEIEEIMTIQLKVEPAHVDKEVTE